MLTLIRKKLLEVGPNSLFMKVMFYFCSFLHVLIAPPMFIWVLLRQKNYRKHFWERLGRFGENSARQESAPNHLENKPKELCFWIHAVSVGEVMAALPLIKGLQSRFPFCRIVFSTFTPTGREIAEKRCATVQRVFYLPFDTYPITAKVIDTIRPDMVILVETDIWPVFVWTLARKGIPSILVNGHISQRRRRVGLFYQLVFRQMSYFCMRSPADMESLLRIGIDVEKTALTGNMKYAQAAKREGDPARLRRELRLPEDANLLIAGSTHEGEEEEIIKCYLKLKRMKMRWILMVVPRHPERATRVESLFRSYGLMSVRRNNGADLSGDPVWILDSMGELSAAYALGTVAFVGGSFVKRGGHNLLEPAAWSKPVFFGPHVDNFSDIASMLQSAGGGMMVRDGDELASRIEELVSNEPRLEEMGRRACSFVTLNQTAVDKNLDIIQTLVKERENSNSLPGILKRAGNIRT